MITSAEYVDDDNQSVFVTYESGPSLSVGTAKDNKHRKELDKWVLEGGAISPYVAPPPTNTELKMIGVEYDGVMCSATAEDQHGLSDIEAVVLGGFDINFQFENGNTLILTTQNWAAFRAVWFAFRISFFPLP